MTYFKDPTVSVTHRRSSIGAGYVLHIKNTGKEPLYDVAVQQFGGKAGKAANRLDLGETVEAGWMELGFTIKEGTCMIGARGTTVWQNTISSRSRVSSSRQKKGFDLKSGSIREALQCEGLVLALSPVNLGHIPSSFVHGPDLDHQSS